MVGVTRAKNKDLLSRSKLKLLFYPVFLLMKFSEHVIKKFFAWFVEFTRAIIKEI